MKEMELENNELELRMYFFVPYNISPIQQAIQAGHAAIQYAYMFGNEREFIDFAYNWKTWIILNGGTTNDELDFQGVPLGTLNQIGDTLNENDIRFSFFREPDLNNSLTALCFIVDERVFNKKDYPEFVDFILDNIDHEYDDKEIIRMRMKKFEELKIIEPTLYKEWIRMIGGIKNEFLRELLRDKKLA